MFCEQSREHASDWSAKFRHAPGEGSATRRSARSHGRKTSWQEQAPDAIFDLLSGIPVA